MSLKPMTISKSSEQAGANKMRASPKHLETLRQHGGDFAAFIEVGRDGYVPPGLKVREQLKSRMFTADVTAASLDALIADEGVIAITPATDIQPVSR
jgi:hypothetical protein